MADAEFKALDSDQRGKIADALTKQGAVKPCSRCSHDKFQIIEGLAAIPLQNNLKTFSLGGTNIPCALVACQQCGNVSFHALGALELMEEFNKTQKKDEK